MKITKTQYEELPAWAKKNFKAVEGDDNHFDNGEEDAGGLKTALEKEKAEKVKVAQERDAAKKEAADAQKAKDDAAAKKAAESGDFSKIEESYKTQLAESAKKVADAEARADRLALETHTESVIGQLLPSFTSAKAGRAVLASMMKTELVDGKPVTRFLDGKGQPTALDVEGFRKNLLADSDLKGILVASKGSGGGSTNSNGGGGSTSTTEKFDAAKATPKDLVAHLEAKGLGGEADD